VQDKVCAKEGSLSLLLLATGFQKNLHRFCMLSIDGGSIFLKNPVLPTQFQWLVAKVL